jgi:hypothetical protein
MKRGLALLLLLALAAGLHATPADWRLSPREVRDGVKAVVTVQLEALQREDFRAAYALASRGIRQQFRLPVYERMIRRGYGAMLRHRRAETGVVQDNGDGLATLPVFIRPAEGATVRYRYHLVWEEEAWRVNGVMPEPPAAPGEI